MRKWLSEKLFDLAVRLDWDTAADRAKLVVLVDGNLQDTLMLSLGEPKKRGRPKGRKDGVGPKPAPKKRGRPAKPATWRTHTWVPAEKPAPKKRGRPLGSKNKPKETIQ